jgi:glycerol-3-phosphate dehydrogenase (NAD(P)+)
VANGLPTALTVAANDSDYAKMLAGLLCNATLRPYVSQDIIGLEIGGAAKNVMAIAAGIADGLGYGANTRSALITRGLHEISCLSQKLGAENQTIMGLSGLGDLLLTCTDDQSRNRRMGLAIGRGQSVEQAEIEIQQVVEGIQAARQIYSMAQELAIEMPIVEQVYRVLYQGLAPQKAVQNLLTRDYKSE